MNFIKSVVKQFRPETISTIYSVEIDTLLLEKCLYTDLVDQIVIRLADEYAKEFGPEILKRIQEQTIESKVIQKVISNLRKELK